MTHRLLEKVGFFPVMCRRICVCRRRDVSCRRVWKVLEKVLEKMQKVSR